MLGRQMVYAITMETDDLEKILSKLREAEKNLGPAIDDKAVLSAAEKSNAAQAADLAIDSAITLLKNAVKVHQKDYELEEPKDSM